MMHFLQFKMMLHLLDLPERYQHSLSRWFLTGGTRTPWGYQTLKQGVRSTKLFLGYTPRK